ncbi:MAG: pilus assembly protein PilN [Piscirickettsiaceae bacterium]|nr:MAG: pilus assembly protein PilN [Piscirickettsiaceae bacterium]
MAKINLLPWREDLRQQRQNDFLVMLGIGLAAASVLMIMVHVTYNGMTENQNNRNQYLQREIVVFDKKIKEIKALGKTKRQLISRMEVIQRLQSSRPEIVHMFDQLAKTVPEGVYLTKFSQQGKSLNISGNAQSNTRVSAYMRSLEKSPWLKGADLNIIKAKGVDVNGFTLKVSQEKLKDSTEGK